MKATVARRVRRGVVVVLIASAGYLSTTGLVNSAPPSVDRQDHRYWYNPTTQQLDPLRMPARMRISVPWLSDWAWIDPLAVMPTPKSPVGDGPFSIFDSEYGGNVVAEFYRSAGVVEVGQTRFDGNAGQSSNEPVLAPAP